MSNFRVSRNRGPVGEALFGGGFGDVGVGLERGVAGGYSCCRGGVVVAAFSLSWGAAVAVPSLSLSRYITVIHTPRSQTVSVTRRRCDAPSKYPQLARSLCGWLPIIRLVAVLAEQDVWDIYA